MKSLFTFIFVLSLIHSSITPSLIVFFDCDFEVSSILDTTEEEKEGKESFKDIRLEFNQDDNRLVYNLLLHEMVSSFEFYSIKYSSEFQELISPPPEHSFL